MLENAEHALKITKRKKKAFAIHLLDGSVIDHCNSIRFIDNCIIKLNCIQFLYIFQTEYLC